MKNDTLDFLPIARQVIEEEGKAVLALTNILGEKFNKLCRLILNNQGRVVFIGMGKSHIIGKKAAASLSSLGTPSISIHAADAVHGDMGMLTKEDIAIFISHSGESQEVVYLLPYIRKIGAYCVAIVGNPNSTLAKSCDMFLETGVRQEAGPIKYAPSASTLVTQALCDGLAMSLAVARGFNDENFHQFHPGGHIGATLSAKKK